MLANAARSLREFESPFRPATWFSHRERGSDLVTPPAEKERSLRVAGHRWEGARDGWITWQVRTEISLAERIGTIREHPTRSRVE